VASGDDPYAVLGLRPDADQAEIHAAYRKAVRRTHPDAGGTAAEFEAVQDAYEAVRDAPRRRTAGATGGGSGGSRPAAPRRRPAPPTAGDVGDGRASSAMEAILAESRRLEDEARRLAGLPPRHGVSGSDAPGSDASRSPPAESTDSVGAILRDAGDQLREAADAGARELRRRLCRLL
jgi:curved DNA-binding protein CbpA